MIARGTLRSGSRTRLVATAAPSMPKNEKSSRADALGSAVHEPPCARTGPTSPAWNASSPATARIARAAIFTNGRGHGHRTHRPGADEVVERRKPEHGASHGERREPTRPQPEQ